MVPLVTVNFPHFLISHQTLIIPFDFLKKSHHFKKVVHLKNHQNSYSFILSFGEFL
jgi:hypothetical protein